MDLTYICTCDWIGVGVVKSAFLINDISCSSNPKWANETHGRGGVYPDTLWTHNIKMDRYAEHTLIPNFLRKSFSSFSESCLTLSSSS